MRVAPGNPGAPRVVGWPGCVGSASQRQHRATCEARATSSGAGTATRIAKKDVVDIRGNR